MATRSTAEAAREQAPEQAAEQTSGRAPEQAQRQAPGQAAEQTSGRAPEQAQRQAPEHQTCNEALVRAFGFLGKRWNGVLLGTLVQGPLGFAELKRSVAGISDSVLSDRLTELTRAGLVHRTVDAGPPVAVSYGVTDSGAALVPALDALRTWAEENLTPERCRGEH